MISKLFTNLKGVRRLSKTALIRSNRTGGFTLVELLVVIAIIAILAAVVVLIINPLELTRRGRDATRLSDLANLQQAINVYAQESAGAATVFCQSGDPSPCPGDSFTGTRTTDGTGWVRANIGSQTSVTVPTLPIDPSNSATYFYRYSGRDGATPGWELNSKMESQQYANKVLNSQDGGNSNNWYEVGSVYTLLGD